MLLAEQGARLGERREAAEPASGLALVLGLLDAVLVEELPRLALCGLVSLAEPH